MLILSRKDGEEVLIGDDIVVKVIESSKGVVKLGFEAPEEIMILRGELENAVKETNMKANQESSVDVLLSLRDKLV